MLTEDCSYKLGQRQVTIPPDACSVVCGLEGMRDSSVARHLGRMVVERRYRDPEAVSDLRGLVMNNWLERATVLEPFGPEGTHISDDRLADYVQRIRRMRPGLLMALPEYLQALAEYLERSGHRPPMISVVRPMGANLDAVSRTRIERAFGTQVREHYGSLELGGMAFDCRFRNGLHVLSDQFHVEIVRHGQPVEPGQLGSVLITDLHNFTMPLIRYQIGDMGFLDLTSCACGRPSPRLFLEGRLEDTIVTDDEKVVTPEAVAKLLYGSGNVDQFQLIEQASGRCELRVVPVAGQTVNVDRLVALCRQLLGDGRVIKVREVRSILPETSGKFRHCKSSSYRRLIDSSADDEVRGSGTAPSPDCTPGQSLRSD